MDADEEDYVFYGTPIEREEDTSARKRKAIADAGQLRTLPAWKQEVRDEGGRRRFHGAFTGGFSAGYYNTAGSKEGWTPQTFTSSRKSRGEVKQQSIYNFLDEDDLKDMGGHALETSMNFDTFGFTAAEYARKQAEKEQEKRPSAIPGPVPDELVLPAAHSIGVKLLMKMGWRQGRSIKETNSDFLYESRREARKAFLAFSGNKEASELAQTESNRLDTDAYPEKSSDFLCTAESTPVYVLNPKQDLHGLGYDPFRLAPEFRDWKRLQNSKSTAHGGDKSKVLLKGNLLMSNSGKYAPGFGIGALEELDIEDEDIYASGFEFEQTEVEEVEPSKMISDNKYKLEDRKLGVLLGFKVASNTDYKLERFHPPVIPADFEPRHKFLTPLETVDKFTECPPPEVSPPEDSNLRLLIEGSAAMVARCGKFIEDLYKEKGKTNPLFLFLSGGDGHSYYERRLWEQKQKYVGQQRQDDVKSKPYVGKMTAEDRGKVLGEKPLDRSPKVTSPSFPVKEAIHLQSNLIDTFTKPISLGGSSESAKPFKSDPAKQERFEQFLKEKFQGGLRSAQSLLANSMSEGDRARERLDFEAAVEAIEKGKWNTETGLSSGQQLKDLPGIGDMQFISSRENDEKVKYPRREEFQWRPSPILCKRFDIIDPFMGKPPPLQKPRSRVDTLIFMTESVKGSKTDEAEEANRDSLHVSQSGSQQAEKQLTMEEPDIEPNAMNVERPVDLYKAIFSDDSDDDEDHANPSQLADPLQTNEGANMTLNRLVAGDFLESLGKELGLEVPSDIPGPAFRAHSLAPAETASKGDIDLSSRTAKSTAALGNSSIAKNKGKVNETRSVDNAEAGASSIKRHDLEVPFTNGDGHIPVTGLSVSDIKDDKSEKMEHRSERKRSMHRRSRSRTPDSDSSSDQNRAKKSRAHSRHRRSRSRSPDTDSSSEHRRAKRNRSRARHHRSKTANTDSSSDQQTHEHSRSGGKKSSSKGKSRKKSRHHKHKRKDSPIRYSGK
ncbi:G patch domain-containing protein TGH homolog isoform X2 [Typha latifolia]|uniref:G patch domain-containing protein TGH homolog isoform X2 n=1 Tax=Typha latifolia TaxID=4733 RepID=UPI003C2D24A2